MSSLHIRSQLSVALQVTPKPAGEHTSISIVKFYSTYIYMNMYEIYNKCVLMPYISTEAWIIIILKNWVLTDGGNVFIT